MHAFGGQGACHQWVGGSPRDGQRARCGPLQAYCPFGQEGIGQTERQALQCGFGVYLSFAILLPIGTCQHGYLIVVLCDHCIYVVTAVGIGEVNGVQTHIAHRCAFVGHASDADVG